MRHPATVNFINSHTRSADTHSTYVSPGGIGHQTLAKAWCSASPQRKNTQTAMSVYCGPSSSDPRQARPRRQCDPHGDRRAFQLGLASGSRVRGCNRFCKAGSEEFLFLPPIRQTMRRCFSRSDSQQSRGPRNPLASSPKLRLLELLRRYQRGGYQRERLRRG